MLFPSLNFSQIFLTLYFLTFSFKKGETSLPSQLYALCLLLHETFTKIQKLKSKPHWVYPAHSRAGPNPESSWPAQNKFHQFLWNCFVLTFWHFVINFSRHLHWHCHISLQKLEIGLSSHHCTYRILHHPFQFYNFINLGGGIYGEYVSKAPIFI